MPKGKKVVGRNTKQDLPLADARQVLSEVEGQVKPGQTARDQRELGHRRGRRIVSTASPTFSQIKTRVATIRQKVPACAGDRHPFAWTLDRRSSEVGWRSFVPDSPVRLAPGNAAGPPRTRGREHDQGPHHAVGGQGPERGHSAAAGQAVSVRDQTVGDRSARCSRPRRSIRGCPTAAGLRRCSWTSCRPRATRRHEAASWMPIRSGRCCCGTGSG